MEYPSRLLMIIDITNMKFNANVESLGRYWAIVRATENDTRIQSKKHSDNCLLIDTFDTDIFIRIISCKAIKKPVFVIPDVTNTVNESHNTTFESNQVIKIKEKKQWPLIFLKSNWI